MVSFLRVPDTSESPSVRWPSAMLDIRMLNRMLNRLLNLLATTVPGDFSARPFLQRLRVSILTDICWEPRRPPEPARPVVNEDEAFVGPQADIESRNACAMPCFA